MIDRKLGLGEIVGLPALADNYIWLFHDAESGETAVVDAGATSPVMVAAEARGWRITQIWNTHWHPDHTDANLALKAATGCNIIGPNDPHHPIPGIDTMVDDGAVFRIGNHDVHVLATPGHTAVHLCFHVPAVQAVFTGDTLFALGCGRLFEGTAEQMFQSLGKLSALPPSTSIYCAHEYTLANGRFAQSVEPGNAALSARMHDVERKREAGEPTVPSTIGDELATNPFVRASDAVELATLRSAKDSFKP
jgi:hydroxyacylglutathione hydrolase